MLLLERVLVLVDFVVVRVLGLPTELPVASALGLVVERTLGLPVEL